MKIVFFGDSLTQGTLGVDYVDKVAHMLRGHHFINSGVNGDTSLNLYRRVEPDVLAHQPDGVLILIGINDALSYVEPGYRPYIRLVKRIAGGQISPISFRENMRALITRLLADQVQTWVVLPPIESRPLAVETLRQMNASATEVCREFDIPVLNLMNRLTPTRVPERPPLSLLKAAVVNWRRSGASADAYERLRVAGGYAYSFDGVHLTEKGAQVFAEEITRFLRNHGVSG